MHRLLCRLRPLCLSTKAAVFVNIQWVPHREAENKTNQTYFVIFHSGVYWAPKLCECLIGKVQFGNKLASRVKRIDIYGSIIISQHIWMSIWNFVFSGKNSFTAKRRGCSVQRSAFNSGKTRASDRSLSSMFFFTHTFEWFTSIINISKLQALWTLSNKKTNSIL